MDTKILIADDDPIVHESLKIYLEAEGFKTVDYYDGISAVAGADSSVSLCVLDIILSLRRFTGGHRDQKRGCRLYPTLTLRRRNYGMEIGYRDRTIHPYGAHHEDRR